MRNNLFRDQNKVLMDGNEIVIDENISLIVPFDKLWEYNSNTVIELVEMTDN